MKALTAEEMARVDRLTTERYGISSLELMKNAGRRVIEYLSQVVPPLEKKKVLVLCGKGNNGGDGLVAARFLVEAGCTPTVLVFAPREKLTRDAAISYRDFEEAGGTPTQVTSDLDWQQIWAAIQGNVDVVLDGLLGTGLKGSVEGLQARVIQDINGSPRRLYVLAIDTPSGLPSDGGAATGPLMQAGVTITFTAPKVGQLVSPSAAAVGKLEVREIGSPINLINEVAAESVTWLEPSEFRGLRFRRALDSNKGSFGHVLVIAGSLGKTGAAILTGSAALRVGAGLVTVATADSVLPIVASSLPDLMTEPLNSTDAGTIALRSRDYGRISTLAVGKSVATIGPGLSRNPETASFTRTVVSELELPLVLDADGLNAFEGCAADLRKRASSHLAVTPHPGEMARLTGKEPSHVQANRLETARQAAREWNCIVVLKGFHTIIASPDGHAFVNTTGGPSLAKGGTGDVLTGILSGLTAQFGVSNWGTVLGLGVYVHGLAGELAGKELGEASVLASDVLDCLPRALLNVTRECG